MRLLRRRIPQRTKRMRPAKRYLAAGADEARRLGHSYVGTEHLLLALTRDPEGGVTRVLGQLGVGHEDINSSSFLARVWAPRMDADALAALGIDLERVRERLEDTFGHGALEEARAGMEPTDAGIRCIAPRLKKALANAVERAGDQPVRGEHVLLGMLSVSDSLAARVLTELGVSLEAVEEIVKAEIRN
jgi:ATP-dependent Clp protease ATP-binding subunit ClpA